MRGSVVGSMSGRRRGRSNRFRTNWTRRTALISTESQSQRLTIITPGALRGPRTQPLGSLSEIFEPIEQIYPPHKILRVVLTKSGY